MKNENESNYEAMVQQMAELGYRDAPVVDEEAEVAFDILRDLTWQEHAPLSQRLGLVEGMAEYLHSRPLPESDFLAKKEIALLEVLVEVAKLADELSEREEPENFAEEMACAEARCRFEDILFAVLQDFFELVEDLDEEWTV